MSAINTVVPIDNNPDLVRDMGSKAVVSKDVTGLLRYKEHRRRSVLQRDEFTETKKRLACIENEMTRLKQIISELGVLRNRG